MPEFEISTIAQIVDARAEIFRDGKVSELCIDSRRIHSPEQSVFIALKGPNHDGHQFIEEVWKKGIRSFIVEEGSYVSQIQGMNLLWVKDAYHALHRLAAHNRSLFGSPVIGITGSNGKTIVKEWLYQCLTGYKKVIRSPKSYNSQSGVPLSLWLLEKDFELAIIEAGISKPGEMVKLEKIIQPDYGIITNIGEAHQENFISHEQKIEEKLMLFQHSGLLFYCRDHQQIHKVIQKLYGNKPETITWSREGNGDFNISGEEVRGSYTLIRGVFHDEEIEYELPFTDYASIENSLHVATVLLQMKLDHVLIAERLKELSPVEMRLEMKRGRNDCILINDYYNSDMNSFIIAVDALEQQTQKQKKTIILSDILQSKTDDRTLYAEVSRIIAHKNINRFIGIGKNILQYQDLFSIPSSFYPDTEKFLEALIPGMFHDEVILLKGSRSFRFETISRVLEEKYHRTRLEINLTALTHNLNYFRSLLKPETSIMVMVKAFAYGSGSDEVAGLLEYNRVDYLGVAYIDEGISLRKAGITVPIFVMNPEPDNLMEMIDFELEPEIYGFSILKRMIDAIRKKGIQAYPCHIKLDTGMHRLGFMPGEIGKLIDILATQDAIKVKSIFSHLAASDDPSLDWLTRHQMKTFGEMSQQIMEAFPCKIMRHILNTSGITRFPEAHYDMVRLGIGLYGFGYQYKDNLKNVATLKTAITQIKDICKGETVGYNPREILEKDMRLGIIPVGYADGLSRKMGNKQGKVLVNKQLASIVGNICMDMCMIDLNNIVAGEGDEVIIFGEGHDAAQMAEKTGTIAYEILTGISERVKRIFYSE